MFGKIIIITIVLLIVSVGIQIFFYDEVTSMSSSSSLLNMLSFSNFPDGPVVTSTYNPNLPQRITNPMICKDTTCSQLGEWTNDLVVHWEVDNGIGCCSTFGCNYDVFRNFCLEPFRLYEVYLDDVQVPITNIDYTCERTTPYNNVVLQGVSMGAHSVRIVQKDCQRVVDQRIIDFTLYDDLQGGFLLEQWVI